MSEQPRALSLLERVFTRSLVAVMSRYIGPKNEHDKAVADEFVRTMGLRGFFRYMKFVGAFVSAVEPVFGAANTQTLIGLASLIGGCGYCGYGHTLAGALLRFKETDELHPVHPHSIAALFELEDHEVVEKLDEMLTKPGFEDLRRQTKRMYEIFLGELEPETEEDELLKGILDFWRWTVECTIIEGIHIVPENAKTFNSIGRDKALRKRYDAALAAEREAMAN